MADEAGSRVNRQRVLVVGLGTMGLSHARAYKAIDGFEASSASSPATPPDATISTRSFPASRATKA